MSQKSNKKKAVFVTFNRIGYHCLETLINSQLVDIACLFTLKPELTAGISDYQDPSNLAKKHNVPVKYIKNLNHYVNELKQLRPALIFVIGWSQIIKKEILALPELGCIGFHPALIPKNRGRAAIPWHFINEDKFGGATLFYLNEGCDAGDIICQKKFALAEKDNAKTYYEQAQELAGECLKENLADILAGQAKRIKQNETEASYLLIRRPPDSFLDFNKMTSQEIFNQIRAVAYIYPTAFAYYQKQKVRFYQAALVPQEKQIYSATLGQIIKIKNNWLWVKTIDGIIELKEVKNENNQPIDCQRFFKIGYHLNRNN